MKIILFFFIVFSSLYPAQSFDYERTYGTYYGPAVTDLGGPANMGYVFFNPSLPNNIYVNGSVAFGYAPLTDAQYNQYVVNSTNYVESSTSYNTLHGVFSSTGNAVLSEYLSPNDSNDEYQWAFDGSGNGISTKKFNASADVASSNVWFTSNPNNASSTETKMLFKKGSNGTLLWKTFLPNEVERILQDDSGNIYVQGSTQLQNIGTAGTFQPNYTVDIDPTTNQPYSNAFIAKLSSTGQLQWTTYFYSKQDVVDIAYYNNHLYIMSNGANSQMATPGTWQPTPTNYALTKMDTATGNRVWGTYIGDPLSTGYVPANLKVNATGIYFLGIQFLFTGVTSYFATPGAFKATPTGDTDYFLVKMDETGNRVWGTYFGSNGYDHAFNYGQLALTDDGIFVTGASYGQTNNIATPGAYQETHPVSTSNGTALYFAKFDITGNQQWCSYYGGSNSPGNLNIPLISIYPRGNGYFYLVGATNASTGISTAGTYQPQLPPQTTNFYTGYVARFDYKGELGSNEVIDNKELQLFDNPNNGNFSLQGDILAKENCNLKIIDASGRIVYQKNLSKQKKINFELTDFLTTASYLVKVSNSKNEMLKSFKMIVH
jgi:hypothetical protein